MDSTTDNSPQSRSTISVSYLILALSVVLIVFFSIAGYILFTGKSPNSVTKTTKSADVLPVLTPTTSPQLLPIDPDNTGVISAGAYYTLVGRIHEITQKDGIYMITLNSQKGERIIENLEVKEADLTRVGTLDEKTQAVTTQPMSSFKKDDLIQVDITGSFKSKVFQVTSVVKIES